MASLPTLMIKGKLVPPDGDASMIKELNGWIPYEYIIDWFRTRLSRTGIINRVLILLSETASGKSTLIPAEIYRSLVAGRGEHAPGIICTQPRVLTAVENVNEILKNYSKVLRRGESIGWSTKYNKLRPRSYGLLSATIGTLTQQLRVLTDEELIAKYRFILIDETHERDLQTDMTIYMLKNFLLRNQNNIACPFVVLMSATFDPKSFLDYFHIPIRTNFIWCRGQTAEIEEMWSWNQDRVVNNYTQAAATVVEIITRDNQDDDPARADILIFMPGKAEFIETARWLRAINKKLALEGKTTFSVIQIDGPTVQNQSIDYKRLTVIPAVDQIQSIDGKKYVPGRRVIISTNVAETGLTLENLKYVIDGGFNREIEFNPVLNIRGLITKPAPKSRVRQRRGRAGRKFRGVFYPLYPQFIHEKLPDLQYPQILLEDVSVVLVDIINEQLKVKKMAGEADPEFLVGDIDMIDVPTPDALLLALEKLYVLGFVSPVAPKWDVSAENILADTALGTRFSFTKLGILAGAFSLISPENIRMIFAAYNWDCAVLDLVTIAAYLCIDSKMFVGAKPRENEDQPPPKIYINWTNVYKAGLPGWVSGPGLVYRMRLLTADDFIDGLILFNAVKQIISAGPMGNLYTWCEKNNISYRTILDFIKMRDEIIEQMLIGGFELFENTDAALTHCVADNFMDTIAKLKHCIYDGYRNNLILRTGEIYMTTTGVQVVPPPLFREDEKKMAEKSEYGIALTVAPTILLYKALGMKYNRKTQMYDVTVDTISAMDGFVSVDPEILN